MKSTGKVEMYSDGPDGYGLFSKVRPRAGGGENKSWVQRISFKKERLGLGLGSYPTVSLKRAREKARANAILVDEGIDPRKSSDECPTFREAAEEAISVFCQGREGSKYERYRWRNLLNNYAMPLLGDKRVDEIERTDVIDVLKPIWNSAPNAGRNVQNRIRRIMTLCMSRGFIENNPVDEVVKAALPKPPKGGHNKAVPYRYVADAVKKIRACGWDSKHAMEFVIYTACRGIEARRAKWSEVDWESRVWTIPESQMKMGREHRVPLAAGAIRVLEAAFERREEGCDRVFPGTLGCNQMADNVMGAACYEAGVDGTPHGFRASFATWCAEKGVPQELAEAALAHMPDEIIQAYTRTDYLERRRPLMDAWSDYIDGKLPADWEWSGGDSPLLAALLELQRLLVEAQAEIAALKGE